MMAQLIAQVCENVNPANYGPAIPNMTELEGCKPPSETEKRPQPLDLSR
jgi:hypothetical protein